MSELVFITSTSSVDRPTSVLLCLRAADGGFIATDYVGRQYGFGMSPGDALADWSEAVHSFCALVDAEDCADHLVREAREYRFALGGDA